MGEGEGGDHREHLWMAVAAGALLGAAALVWLVWYQDPEGRMDRLLRKCQQRIQDIEESLGQLEESLS